MILDDTPVSMAWQASEGEHASGYIPKFVSKAAACRSTSWNCGRSSEASGERSLALNGACQGYSHNDAPSAEEVRKRVKCRDSWDHRSHFQRVSGFPKPLWRCDTRHLRRALFLGSLLELPGWFFFRASRLEDVLWTDVFGTVQDLNKSCLVAAIVSNLESEFWSW